MFPICSEFFPLITYYRETFKVISLESKQVLLIIGSAHEFDDIWTQNFEILTRCYSLISVCTIKFKTRENCEKEKNGNSKLLCVLNLQLCSCILAIVCISSVYFLFGFQQSENYRIHLLKLRFVLNNFELFLYHFLHQCSVKYSIHTISMLQSTRECLSFKDQR